MPFDADGFADRGRSVGAALGLCGQERRHRRGDGGGPAVPLGIQAGQGPAQLFRERLGLAMCLCSSS